MNKIMRGGTELIHEIRSDEHMVLENKVFLTPHIANAIKVKSQVSSIRVFLVDRDKPAKEVMQDGTLEVVEI